MADPVPASPATALVLTGGGGRAAYQVGALKAIWQVLAEHPGQLVRNPFPIICGTSAGAINATALACGADHPRAALRRLLAIWENLRTDRVYRADSLAVMRTGARWLSMLSFGWALAQLHRGRPRSLLDNEPLGELLAASLDFAQLEHNLHSRVLEALAVTASGYTTGRHLTFYQSARDVAPWQRPLRQAVPGRIGVEHLLASSAIPFVFPARRIPLQEGAEWCGDGAMRQLAPISPAIHLGAQRVLVIGVGRLQENPVNERDLGYPTLAQIGAHALSNIFLDSLSSDLQQLTRTNRIAELLSPEQQHALGIRPISVLALTPSRNLDEIAARHLAELPSTMRALLGAVGVSADSGGTGRGGGLASYLLFEPGYTRELVALGWSDTMARAAEVRAFFYGDVVSAPK